MKRIRVGLILGILFSLVSGIFPLSVSQAASAQVGQPGAPMTGTIILSPNGQFQAVWVQQPNGGHYQVKNLLTQKVVYTTHGQSRSWNDVKAGAFNSDSTMFAAAYHYAHKGSYTWIGIWSTVNGKLIGKRQLSGYQYQLAGIFPSRSPVKLPAAKTQKSKAVIQITTVPPHGSQSNLRGIVTGVNPAEYQVAVYIKVRGRWWTKPYWSWPVTPLYSNSTWECDVTTGIYDESATDFAAFLIPRDYTPPLAFGGSRLPASINSHAVARVIAHRSAKK